MVHYLEKLSSWWYWKHNQLLCSLPFVHDQQISRSLYEKNSSPWRIIKKIRWRKKLMLSIENKLLGLDVDSSHSLLNSMGIRASNGIWWSQLKKSRYYYGSILFYFFTIPSTSFNQTCLSSLEIGKWRAKFF